MNSVHAFSQEPEWLLHHIWSVQEQTEAFYGFPSRSKIRYVISALMILQPSSEQDFNIYHATSRGIYERILCRIERPYLEEAALYLQIAICMRISLVGFALAQEDDLDKITGSATTFVMEKLIKTIELVRRRHMVTYAGLLEIRKDQSHASLKGKLLLQI